MPVRGADMLIVAREVQLPLLAVLLIAGCTAKARQALARRSPGTATGPTAMFPLRLRGPAAVGMSATELALGGGLLATAGRAGSGALALGFRSATALLFCLAAAALQELRARRPTAGCGCFGELSAAPVDWRTITRALLLCAAAFATIGLPPLRMPGSCAQACLALAITAAELAAIASLSPEVGTALARLGRAEPCQVRRVPLGETVDALHASGAWRRYRPHVLSAEPSDVWREGCWRFLVFPAVLASRRVDVVFAVYLAGRRPPVRSGLLGVDAAPPGASRHGKPLQLSNRVLGKSNT